MFVLEEEYKKITVKRMFQKMLHSDLIISSLFITKYHVQNAIDKIKLCTIIRSLESIIHII